MLSDYFVYLIVISIGAFIGSGIASAFLKNKRIELILSSAFLAIVAIASSYLLAANYNATYFNLIRINQFSAFFTLLFSVAFILVNLLSFANAKDYPNLSLLLGFSFAGVFAVATAMSLIAILLGLELLALSTTFMMLFEGRHKIEATVKFFVLSSVSVALFTFAIALLLPYNGQLGLVQLPQLPNAGIILLSLAFFAASLGFDTALFPFNLWIPDVYEGTSTHITALLAGVNKKISFVAMIYVFFTLFLGYSSYSTLIFSLLAIATMFFGNLLALVQKSVKRLFAYSSISQAGYIMVGITTATNFGLQSSIFYILAHSFMIIGSFAIIMWLESKNLKTIEDYTALNSRNMFAAAALSIFMLSFAGIPPLIGFVGKFLLFSSAISSGLVILAVFGIINSFISIYYYAKIINSMYARKQAKEIKMDNFVMAVVIIALAVTIAFGLYSQPIVKAAADVAKSLISLSGSRF